MSDIQRVLGLLLFSVPLIRCFPDPIPMPLNPIQPVFEGPVQDNNQTETPSVSEEILQLYGFDIYQRSLNETYTHLEDPSSSSPSSLEWVQTELKNSPEIIIEIGSSLGTLTKKLASLIKSATGRLYTIDIFGVTPIAYSDEKREIFSKLVLEHQNDYDVLFKQFIRQIVAAGLCDKVIPLRQTSARSVQYFSGLNIKPDLIYLNGGKQTLNFIQDLFEYFPILKIEGIIMIPEISIKEWLQSFLQRFSQVYKVPLSLKNQHWILKKTEEEHIRFEDWITLSDLDAQKQTLEKNRSDLDYQQTYNDDSK